ncbi:MAG: hypothetical protein ACI4MH_01445 [Candidatus Coproplasma sp.]
MICMRICVAPYLPENFHNILPECDVAILGFGYLGEVEYESELAGRTDKFGEFARLSNACRCGAVCGCKTDSRGLKRKSAAVADRGKLLGVSDMLHVMDGEEYKSGAGLGLYKLGGYKVGVCVENDLLFPENFKSLSLCGCNLIACISENGADNILPMLIRSYAYLYGVPVVMSAGKCAYFADITGAIACSNQSVTAFIADPCNRYRIISTRRRGLIDCAGDDF